MRSRLNLVSSFSHWFPSQNSPRQRALPQNIVLAGQARCARRRKQLKRERACCVVALACDLYVFTPRFTAGFSAVFFSICYIAQAWYVCALLAFLIRHRVHPFLGRMSRLLSY